MRLDFDYIIVGMGAAGMSLAYYLAKTKFLDQKQILILEKDDKTANNRTWTFWGDPPPPVNKLIQKTWQSVQVRNGKKVVKMNASAMPYHYLPAHKFYEGLLPTINAHPNITWLQETVSGIHEDESGAYVAANNRTFTGTYIFNSAYPFTSSLPQIQNNIAYQRFKGWEVVFDDPVVEDRHITLMDFALPHSRDLRFMYMLPLNPNRLILNCTSFGHETLTEDYANNALGQYLDNHFSGAPYRIERNEGGLIPMSHTPLKRYWGKRVINMGILGGDTRPSTGYTFLSAVRFARVISQALSCQTAWPKGQWGARPRFYDALFLQVLADNPNNLRRSLMAVFQNNRAKTIFRFLDGSSFIWEELRLLLTLPYTPFLKALGKHLKSKPINHESGLLPTKS